VSISKYYLDREALAKDIRLWSSNGYKVIICGKDVESAESIRNSLADMEVGAEIIPMRLDRGAIFHSCKLVIIGTGEIINERKAHIRVSKKDMFTLPEAGDYVVHEVHGIGRCEGIVRLTAAVGERDYIKVSYANEDKLYVPVEQMNLLSRYAGSDVQPRLNKMGGIEFERIKERARASVKAMAVDLLHLYNEREGKRGFKYQEDTVFQTEFEDAFPYQETDDQLTAAEEIKQDMESGKIMDRLLVGDVGYGKTEVALRAVFKTVMDGKQAAILAPTTVLSQQHYNTCSERFSAWGLRVGCVNRFRTAAEIAQTLKLLEEHKIDVICGTHRLLSKDVKFAQPGLLVLDEEQRFGVEQKELIKDLRKDINVLSLSATPIPRTLHMSLSGIRDISVLETAPAGRLPIETYVTAYSDALVIDAIRREKTRGGQCFILYNRVESIEKFSAHISELLPDVRVLFAHGQMSGNLLEDTISRFFEQKADVLISTTIIENGIDLPTANTLIICDADRLGLSALYQLRGRVGRGSRLAYAYFTYEEGKVLTDNAYQRLSAIMDYTELGSGFKIAMRDLEIRGAGNILGREQHGHMEKVGYDLYCKLLGESVGEMMGGKAAFSINAEVKIEIEAQIPETYIAEEKERMRVYRRLSALSDTKQYDKLYKELSDLYNKPPQAVLNLMKIALIRNLASAIGAKLVYNNGKGAGIEFTGDAWKSAKIVDAVGTKNRCYLSAAMPPSVIFETEGMTAERKNELILQFLNQINK